MAVRQQWTHIDDLPGHCLQVILSRVGDHSPPPFPSSKLPPTTAAQRTIHPLQCAAVSRHWRNNAYEAVRSLSLCSLSLTQTSLRNLSRFVHLTHLTLSDCHLFPLTHIQALVESTPSLESLALPPSDGKPTSSSTHAKRIGVSLTSALASVVCEWKYMRHIDLGSLLSEGDKDGTLALIANLEKLPTALERLSLVYSPSFFDPPLPLADICASPTTGRLVSSLHELHLKSSELPPPLLISSPALASLHLFSDDWGGAATCQWAGTDVRSAESLGVECHMAGLRSLSLSGCEVDELPSSIGNLSRLRHLALEECDVAYLPSTLPELRELESLELTVCLNLRALPGNLGAGRGGGLRALSTLHIVDCCALSTLPPALCGLASLTSLQVINCSGLKTFMPTIAGLASLKSLRVSMCPLTDLPADVGALTQLQVLDISFCHWERLPPSVGALRSLLELDVSGCGSLKALPEEVSGLWSLVTLRMSDCKALRSLPSDMGNLRSLKELHLAGCHSLRVLPCSLTSISGLEVLQLEGVCPEVVFPVLAPPRSSPTGGAPVGGVGEEGVGAFRKLKALCLEASDAELSWVPETLAGFTSLESLQIGGAFLRGWIGAGGGQLPPPLAFLRSMKKLRKLELTASAMALSEDVAKLPALELLVWKAPRSSLMGPSSSVVCALRSRGVAVISLESL